MDVVQKISSEEIHVILETDGSNFSKYVDNETNVVSNQHNELIKKHPKVFETTNASDPTNSKYVDPFNIDENKFTEKNKAAGLQKKVFSENETQSNIFTVYETIESYKSNDILFDIYPIGTELPIIAMANKTTVSNIIKWFSEDLFDKNAVLTQETLLCKEKIIDFRYGRQVGIRKEFAQQEKIVIDEWGDGVATLALQQPFLLNYGKDCVATEMIERPPAMDLCDEFFINKALLSYCNKAE